jgi:hypothetical protein
MTVLAAPTGETVPWIVPRSGAAGSPPLEQPKRKNKATASKKGVAERRGGKDIIREKEETRG